VSKPYSEMTSSERIRDRIAKNRRIEQSVFSGNAGSSLDGPCDYSQLVHATPRSNRTGPFESPECAPDGRRGVRQAPRPASWNGASLALTRSNRASMPNRKRSPARTPPNWKPLPRSIAGSSGRTRGWLSSWWTQCSEPIGNCGVCRRSRRSFGAGDANLARAYSGSPVLAQVQRRIEAAERSYYRALNHSEGGESGRSRGRPEVAEASPELAR